MTDVSHPVQHRSGQQMPNPRKALFDRLTDWYLDRVASPSFQSWAARSFFARPFMRRDSQKIFDLVSGFVYSQTLLACVELDVLQRLKDQPATAESLAVEHGLDPARMRALLQSAAAIDLIVLKRDGIYRLGRLGAAILGVSGLQDMILHHQVFYRDLSDPVALLKGQTDPELSHFWPYVQGAEAAADPEIAKTYSHLMATSQNLVAEETLNAVGLNDVCHLLDVGGGTGVFLQHVANRHPKPRLQLIDLPAVALAARERLGSIGLQDRIAVTGGSFLDALPEGADAISLIRVLYDHDDDTVRNLLQRVFEALPAGGTLLLSEPMSGGVVPNRFGDSYFGFYTMAMTTGRPRSAARHTELLREAGFSDIRERVTRRPFLTNVITARRRSV